MESADLLVIGALSYAVGSIATSVWIGRGLYRIDVRRYGSGSTGATNTLRVLGWKPALIVFLFDISKGIVPTLYVSQLQLGNVEVDERSRQLLAGLAAVCGHVWPIFAGFRGGKGIATATGMMLILSPSATLVGALVFLVVLRSTRYVSLANMIAVTSVPLALLLSRSWTGAHVDRPLLLASWLLVPFFLFTHRSNINRLVLGSEHRIRRYASAAPQPDEPS